VFHRLSADLIVLVHIAFVLFAVLGGLLVLRWRRLAWVHVPAALWAAAIEFAGWICPLTPLENWLRRQAGEGAYEGGFIEHHILPILYPAALTRRLQIVLGLLVIVLNVAIYAWVFLRKKPPRGGGAARSGL
jgi:hypothetical protein